MCLRISLSGEQTKIWQRNRPIKRNYLEFSQKNSLCVTVWQLVFRRIGRREFNIFTLLFYFLKKKIISTILTLVIGYSLVFFIFILWSLKSTLYIVRIILFMYFNDCFGIGVKGRKLVWVYSEKYLVCNGMAISFSENSQTIIWSLHIFVLFFTEKDNFCYFNTCGRILLSIFFIYEA